MAISQLASDADLLSSAQHGEPDAYEALVQRYQRLAMQVAVLITHDAEDAEDVVQEALFKAYSTLGRAQPEAFRGWLLRIVTNEARNRLKAERRRSAAFARAADQQSANPGRAADAEEAVLMDEERTVLLQALDQLKEHDRLVIAYRYFFDLSESELVEALGWQRGTVKSRLSRALGRFRVQLGHLAMLPIGAFSTANVARTQAECDVAALEHNLVGLGAHLSQRTVPDVSAAVMARIHAMGANPQRSGSASSTWIWITGGSICAVVVMLVASNLRMDNPVVARPATSVDTPSVLASPAVLSDPIAVTTSIVVRPSPPMLRTTTVYGADLTELDRLEVSRLLGVSNDSASETAGGDEVLSTLTAAGQPAAPTDKVISSVALTCPGPTPGIVVRTEHFRSYRR